MVPMHSERAETRSSYNRAHLMSKGVIILKKKREYKLYSSQGTEECSANFNIVADGQVTVK